MWTSEPWQSPVEQEASIRFVAARLSEWDDIVASMTELLALAHDDYVHGGWRSRAAMASFTAQEVCLRRAKQVDADLHDTCGALRVVDGPR